MTMQQFIIILSGVLLVSDEKLLPAFSHLI